MQFGVVVFMSKCSTPFHSQTTSSPLLLPIENMRQRRFINMNKEKLTIHSSFQSFSPPPDKQTASMLFEKMYTHYSAIMGLIRCCLSYALL